MKVVPLLVDDKEYAFLMPSKAADLLISDMEECLEREEYMYEPLLFETIRQLTHNIGGGLYPVNVMPDDKNVRE